ncbi:uncharacterized protein MONBRDRAFT_22496 [Monosiga brevicollis MX1]|uniref:Ras-GEF domain-containing protein n=1 Tax=Monosiga brevicollis TaxID=81824 RepID=A9UQR8_MONBE|nr:uncharacterized protein MONBRDRAFT_22496 [Monosiga brevicollis MX1]EDQ93093.1 predicted protein [Monosiga brevicollis MX1]|eukprot:XP_001742855.1 hypothetical protein [Monosiga brevicollis MX1]
MAATPTPTTPSRSRQLRLNRRRSCLAIDLEAMHSELTDEQLRLEEDAIFNAEETFASEFDDTLSAEERAKQQITDRIEKLIPPEDIAQQLTLLDIQSFRAISKKELVNCAWTRVDKMERAPNVMAMTHRFNNVGDTHDGQAQASTPFSADSPLPNRTPLPLFAQQISYWIARTILFGPDETRVDRLAHCIKLARKLHEYNNLHSLLAVMSGLHMTPVYRLQHTWQLLRDKYAERFERLEEFLSEDDNFATVREHLTTTKLPCIPYLGMFLTDLMHNKTASKREEAYGCAAGVQEQDRIFSQLEAFQASEYGFPVIGFVRDLLLSINIDEAQMQDLDNKHYQKSLEIEPRRKSDESQERTVDLPFRFVNGRLSAAVRTFKNSSLPFRSRTPNKGHRKTRSLGGAIVFWNTAPKAQEIVTTSAASSMANADSSALLEDEDDEPQSSAHSSRPDEMRDASDSEEDEAFTATSPLNEKQQPVSSLDMDAEQEQYGELIKEGHLRHREQRRLMAAYRSMYGHSWVRLRAKGVLIFKQRVNCKGQTRKEAFSDTPWLQVDVADLQLSVDPNSKHNSFHLAFDEGNRVIKFQANQDEYQEWIRAFSTTRATEDLAPWQVMCQVMKKQADTVTHLIWTDLGEQSDALTPLFADQSLNRTMGNTVSVGFYLLDETVPVAVLQPMEILHHICPVLKSLESTESLSNLLPAVFLHAHYMSLAVMADLLSGRALPPGERISREVSFAVDQPYGCSSATSTRDQQGLAPWEQDPQPEVGPTLTLAVGLYPGHWPHIEACVLTAWNSTQPPDEVVIGASEISFVHANKFLLQLNKAPLVHNRTVIIGRAAQLMAGPNRNAAVSQTMMRIVTVLDADDRVATQRHEIARYLFTKHDCHFIGHSARLVRIYSTDNSTILPCYAQLEDGANLRTDLTENVIKAYIPFAYAFHCGHAIFDRWHFGGDVMYTERKRAQDVEFDRTYVLNLKELGLRACVDERFLTYYLVKHSSRWKESKEAYEANKNAVQEVLEDA